MQLFLFYIIEYMYSQHISYNKQSLYKKIECRYSKTIHYTAL